MLLLLIPQEQTLLLLTNQLVDTETVTVYRFEEKIGSSTVTCFGTFASRNTNIGKIVDSTSISCVK